MLRITSTLSAHGMYPLQCSTAGTVQHTNRRVIGL